MMRFLLIILALIFNNLLIAQTNDTDKWTKIYNTSPPYDFIGKSILETGSDEYIVLVSLTDHFIEENSDIILMKINSIGDTLWTRTYGGASHDFGRSILKTDDGGYIITGEYGTAVSTGPGAYSYYYDLYLIKTNSSGDTLWTKSYDGDRFDVGMSILKSGGAGYIVAGEFKDALCIMETDVNGDSSWVKTYEKYGFDKIMSLDKTNDGGYIGNGNYYGSNDTMNVYLIRFNAEGDTLWTNTYGGNEKEYSTVVEVSSDGGYFFTGYTESYGAGNKDVYLLKTDTNGNLLWYKTYGGSEDDIGYSIKETSDKGLIIAGSTESFGNGESDIYLIRTDINGDTLWTQTIGGVDEDIAYSIEETSDKGFIITGKSDDDLYIIKTDSLGNSHTVTLISELKSKNISMSVFPNPTKDYIICKIEHPNLENLELKLYDINGQELETIAVIKKESFIDISKYPNSIYFLKLSNKTNIKSTIRIIKN